MLHTAPCGRATRGRARAGGLHTARVSAIALLVAVASGCRLAEPGAPVLVAEGTLTTSAGADVTLAPGETAEIPSVNLRVRFNRIVGDSRCPTKSLILCVWQGSVVVELQAGPLTGFHWIETRRLESVPGRDTTSIGGQPIRFVRVTPEKETTDEIPRASYRIVLQVGAPR